MYSTIKLKTLKSVLHCKCNLLQFIHKSVKESCCCFVSEPFTPHSTCFWWHKTLIYFLRCLLVLKEFCWMFTFSSVIFLLSFSLPFPTFPPSPTFTHMKCKFLIPHLFCCSYLIYYLIIIARYVWCDSSAVSWPLSSLSVLSSIGS